MDGFYVVNLCEPYLGQYFLCLDEAIEPISEEMEVPFTAGRMREMDGKTTAAFFKFI